tara:strand:- start:3006 stop:3479 length:474 start_codon:yes stop_codon:yes gene_type:complete
MSKRTDKTFAYRFNGRKLFLYRIRYNDVNFPDQKGRFNMSPEELVYPDEAITDGLRIEYTFQDKSVFVNNDPNELLDNGNNPTLTTETSPKESSHVNVNKMLSLAIVDYIKAMMFEKSGQLELKEYYMKQYYKKIGDNDSNKRKIRFTFASSPFAVR